MWNCNPDELKPYLDYQVREVLFREAVLQFLGVETHDDVVNEYCEACRTAGKDIDCKNCDKSAIVKEKKTEKKTIGR